jgi:spore coat polysaccharide biosynthesis protein SpsF
MSSTRLPGKVLKDLAGKPMLQWVVDAAIDSKLIDGVVVATSTMASDLPIVEYCYKQKIYCTTGPLDDVLARYYQTALEWRATHIVRLTADCPLLTGELIDEVVRLYLQNDLKYIVNIYDGLDVEVFPYDELLKAHKLATDDSDREHVTSYIRRHAKPAGRARVYRKSVEEPFSVNTPEEFERMENILSGLQSYVVKTRNEGRGI